MKIVQFFSIFSAVFSGIFATPCTTTDQIKFLQCKGNILQIQDLLKNFSPPGGEKQPPAAVFKQMAKFCEIALTCVEQIECQEAKRGVAMMTSACRGIAISAGPFGDCLTKLHQNPPPKDKFSCARIFEKDALDTKSKRCAMFTTDAPCVTKIATEHCGSTAAEEFEKSIENMKILLKC